MTTNHFNAILAKNEIAKELMKIPRSLDVNHCYLFALLGDIEKFIGQANQPSIAEIRDAYRKS